MSSLLRLLKSPKNMEMFRLNPELVSWTIKKHFEMSDGRLTNNRFLAHADLLKFDAKSSRNSGIVKVQVSVIKDYINSCRDIERIFSSVGNIQILRISKTKQQSSRYSITMRISNDIDQLNQSLPFFIKIGKLFSTNEEKTQILQTLSTLETLKSALNSTPPTESLASYTTWNEQQTSLWKKPKNPPRKYHIYRLQNKRDTAIAKEKTKSRWERSFRVLNENLKASNKDDVFFYQQGRQRGLRSWVYFALAPPAFGRLRSQTLKFSARSAGLRPAPLASIEI